MKSVGIAQRREGTYGAAKGVSSMTVQQGEVAMVYVDGVYQSLVTAIARYRDSLVGSGSSDARQTFELMFDKYGTLNMV